MAKKETSSIVKRNYIPTKADYRDNYLNSASATDMTGLTPTVARDAYEAESYDEVFPYLPSASPHTNKITNQQPIKENL